MTPNEAVRLWSLERANGECYYATPPPATDGVLHWIALPLPALLAVREALRRLHDECSMVHGEYLNFGPMIEPSERAVLAARLALARLGNKE